MASETLINLLKMRHDEREFGPIRLLEQTLKEKLGDEYPLFEFEFRPDPCCPSRPDAFFTTGKIINRIYLRDEELALSRVPDSERSYSSYRSQVIPLSAPDLFGQIVSAILAWADEEQDDYLLFS